MLNFKLNGNLGRDPEFKQTASGQDYATLYVASNHPGVETPDWFNVAVFNDKALARLTDLAKGDKVNITGSARMNEWTDNNGQTHRATSFVASTVTPAGAGNDTTSAARDAALEAATQHDSVSAGR